MKTALLYKTLALVMLPALIFATNPNNWKGKHTKTKTINKEFAINANGTVKVNNSYGNLDVITWNENRVVFEIIITTNGNDEEKVQKKLDDINVEFDASSSQVSAKTLFNKNKSSSWWKWNKSKVSMKINYIIKMPMSANANLDNNYGSINLDKLNGQAIISCDYGKITTKELMAEDNVLDFDYTKNSYFEYINSASISADYSDFTVAKAKTLTINTDYTQTKIEVAEEIKYNCDYGKMIIEKANSVRGNSDYLTVVLGDIYQNASLNADYGSIKIKRLNPSTKNVVISSDYTGITIGYASDFNFSFDLSLSYASLRDHNGLEINKEKVNSGNKYYSGFHGNSNSGNLIKIESDYGSVSLTEN